MKKLFTLLLFLAFNQVTVAQKIVIMPERNNVVIIGVTNKISIAVENTKCADLIVSVDNGTIKGRLGNYLWNPTKPGIAYIKVFKTTKGVLKEIGSKEFRVHLLPDPTPFIGTGFRSGLLSKEILKKQFFLRSLLEDNEFCYSAAIDSFKLSIARKDSFLVKNLSNKTGKFSDEVIRALQNIDVGDVVVFKEIFLNHFGFPKELDPIIVTVTDGFDVFK